MEIKKNDKFIVTIEDMSEDGAGIGKLDGYIWFIKDALIGDTIEAAAISAARFWYILCSWYFCSVRRAGSPRREPSIPSMCSA